MYRIKALEVEVVYLYIYYLLLVFTYKVENYTDYVANK